ncbi:hypothetical protein K7X08_022958 [Anisodus acutangulus]|uniref:Uncharacterized protein n=1 Tax=Anisodus acutangulus TaxID=402998 RepID=A0A9Q1MFC4_9SOLA|nr:hypothetical protein K7X08_022958 [Anisodus acutangulus]
MLVEINITIHMVYEIDVIDPDGVIFQKSVQYEWKPEFCSIFHTIGHDCQEPREVASTSTTDRLDLHSSNEISEVFDPLTSEVPQPGGQEQGTIIEINGADSIAEYKNDPNWIEKGKANESSNPLALEHFHVLLATSRQSNTKGGRNGSWVESQVKYVPPRQT